MYDCDVLETIALYGTEKIGEPIMPDEVISRRVEAIYRYKDTLKIIFNNSEFIIRKEDKPSFNRMREHLDFVEKMIDGVSKVEENQVTHTQTLVINEEHFRKCLRALQQIKEDVHSPLNSAGVIFRQSDDMSFQELLQDISEGG
jgi:YesN/AraC family two-component response regulator